MVFWVGAILVSLVAIGFAWAANESDAAFHAVLGHGRYWAFAVVPAGLAISVLLTRHVFPGAQGSGIPQVIAALEMNDPRRVQSVLSLRVAAGKILLTLLGLACGASIGREGPTVQVGASIMQAFGRMLALPRLADQRALVLAGGAAGIAAAFNTPLAGIVFAIEELSRSFEHRTSGVVLTAVIIAGIATLALMGNYTYFGVTSAVLPIGVGWAAVLFCAVAGGLAGGLFSEALIRAARGLPGRAGRFVAQRPVMFAALCGLALAVLGLVSDGATYGHRLCAGTCAGGRTIESAGKILCAEAAGDRGFLLQRHSGRDLCALASGGCRAWAGDRAFTAIGTAGCGGFAGDGRVFFRRGSGADYRGGDRNGNDRQSSNDDSADGDVIFSVRRVTPGMPPRDLRLVGAQVFARDGVGGKGSRGMTVFR